jgi:hypothetical protein
MPFDSVGDFLLRATPEEFKAMSEALASAKPDGKPRQLHEVTGIPIKIQELPTTLYSIG